MTNIACRDHFMEKQRNMTRQKLKSRITSYRSSVWITYEWNTACIYVFIIWNKPCHLAAKYWGYNLLMWSSDQDWGRLTALSAASRLLKCNLRQLFNFNSTHILSFLGKEKVTELHVKAGPTPCHVCVSTTRRIHSIQYENEKIFWVFP